MRRLRNLCLGVVIMCGAALLITGATNQKPAAAAPVWSMNASIVEACSCPMFCQCYFSPAPAGHTEAVNGGQETGPGVLTPPRCVPPPRPPTSAS